MGTEWIDIIKDLAKRRGLSLAKVSEKAPLDRSYFRKARERSSTVPRGETLDKIAHALKMSSTELSNALMQKRAVVPVDSKYDDLQFSPELTIRSGAGGGGVIDGIVSYSDDGIPEELIKNRWGLPTAFLRFEAKVQPQAAHILEVTGDSMIDPAHPTAFGTLLPGDRVIIDTTDRIPSPPGPFAVFDGLGLVVKMVEWVHGAEPPKLRLSSRNPAYPPYEVLVDDVQIYGRVRGRITTF